MRQVPYYDHNLHDHFFWKIDVKGHGTLVESLELEKNVRPRSLKLLSLNFIILKMGIILSTDCW